MPWTAQARAASSRLVLVQQRLDASKRLRESVPYARTEPPPLQLPPPTCALLADDPSGLGLSCQSSPAHSHRSSKKSWSSSPPKDEQQRPETNLSLRSVFSSVNLLYYHCILIPFSPSPSPLPPPPPPPPSPALTPARQRVVVATVEWRRAERSTTSIKSTPCAMLHI